MKTVTIKITPPEMFYANGQRFRTFEELMSYCENNHYVITDSHTTQHKNGKTTLHFVNLKYESRINTNC